MLGSSDLCIRLHTWRPINLYEAAVRAAKHASHTKAFSIFAKAGNLAALLWVLASFLQVHHIFVTTTADSDLTDLMTFTLPSNPASFRSSFVVVNDILIHSDKHVSGYKYEYDDI